MNQPTLHDLIDGLELYICGLDDMGAIRVFNRPCERLTGLARDEAQGRSWTDVFAGERQGQVEQLLRVTREDQPSPPFEALSHNGRSLRWQFSRQAKVLPAVSLWAVGIDVTSEREALVRAREVERVDAFRKLVSGLTHEMRNPLNGALLQLAVAGRLVQRREDPALEPATQAIAQAAAEMRRISTLLDDFVVFVRPQPVKIERIDVRQVLARAVERATSKAMAGGVTLIVEKSDCVYAEIDTSRVESATYHLLANAIDASAALAVREVRARLAVRGNAVAIEVEDHGPGLATKDAPIFEPFYTTKEGGTGLGLAIVARVASDLGGHVHFERVNDATLVRLELPIVSGGAT